MPVYKSGGSGGGLPKSKAVKNTSGASIAAKKALAWKNDGSVDLASAVTSTLNDFAGVSEALIANAATGNAIRHGSVPGALTGLGATPGQYVYLSVVPGEFTLTPPHANPSAAIIKVGKAEPSGTEVDGIANDLFIELEEISE